jgi:hypothetical protein
MLGGVFYYDEFGRAASLRNSFAIARSRRAIRSITFTALRRFGGSATIPLAKHQRCASGFARAGIGSLRSPLVSSMLVSST